MGIGAFQVKSFVERAFGVLSVESVEGKGTSFFMDFPEFKRNNSHAIIEQIVEETQS